MANIVNVDCLCECIEGGKIARGIRTEQEMVWSVADEDVECLGLLVFIPQSLL